MGALLVACWLGSAPASAQDTLRTRVRILVRDSLGAPVPDASVTVLRGLRDTITTGATDVGGHRVFLLDRAGGAYQVVSRKIGFARAAQFFTPPAGADSLTVSVRLIRLVTRLAEVTVTADVDAARKSYFIDADEIARSPRPLFTASDIVGKLRPDMIKSRAGRKGPCPGIMNVWVNGILVVKTPPQGMAGLGRIRRGPAGSRPSVVENSGPSEGVGTPLARIRPEHVSEMTYKDCFDTSMPGNYGNSALFVVLKPGIKFDMKFGSYPADAPPPPPRR